MPKLYRNIKLLIPVSLMAILAGLSLMSVRYLNASLESVTYSIARLPESPYFAAYVLETLGRIIFPLFALASLVILFTSKKKGILTLAVSLTAVAGFVPALIVSLFLLLAQRWSLAASFFDTRDSWSGGFDASLAIYHAATWLVIPVLILYLVMSSIKSKPIGEPAASNPNTEAQGSAVRFDPMTGKPIAPAAYVAPAAGSAKSKLPMIALILAFFVPLGAVIVGHISLNQMKQGLISSQNLSMAKTGLILGYVFMGLGFVFGIIFAVVYSLILTRGY